MNTKTIIKKFGTQDKCLKYLEKLRWGKIVTCPYCGSKKTHRYKNEAFRHKCYSCNKSFRVTVDTIFEDTKRPLSEWFVAISLLLNDKSGFAAKEIQRNIGGSYKSSFYMAMRIRCGMLIENSCFQGVVEPDESYYRCIIKQNNDNSNTVNLSQNTEQKRYEIKKIYFKGMIEKKENTITKIIEKLTKRNLLQYLKCNERKRKTLMITDGFSSYNEFDKYIERMIIKHNKEGLDKELSKNNKIEDFWTFVKDGIKHSYKSISPKYLPFYLIEYEWKWNNRNDSPKFEKYLKNVLTNKNDSKNQKKTFTGKVKEIIYNPKTRNFD